MPQFDLRGIKIAEYVNTAGTVTYTGAQSIGDAMSVELALRYAEGRLYAEGTLAEYMKKATGGTISIAVKYIPEAAQKVLFGAREGTRSVSSKQVKSLKFGAKDSPKAVGVAFYCPDMIDGVEKYSAFLVRRAIFGQPSMSLQTMGENIQFSTPTTSGEFMPDHSTTQEMVEIAECDSIADAEAWITAALA